jgi:hypothetical protein
MPTAVANSSLYTVTAGMSSTVTVNFTSGQTANGYSSLTLNPGTSLDFESDGSKWWIK